jgi:hypothetical protein
MNEQLFNAKTQELIISKEEAENIVGIVSKIDEWENAGSDFWDGRALNYSNIYENHDKELGLFLFKLIDKIKNSITEMYGLEQEIYPDLLQVIRWFPGQEQPPHSDNMMDTEHHEENQHRVFGAIIYLNDNYKGGCTYYPQYGIEIKPEVGKLAVHPGDTDHMHGVSKIEDSIRYTIASFWTFDKNRFYDYQIEV